MGTQQGQEKRERSVTQEGVPHGSLVRICASIPAELRMAMLVAEAMYSVEVRPRFFKIAKLRQKWSEFLKISQCLEPRHHVVFWTEIKPETAVLLVPLRHHDW